MRHGSLFTGTAMLDVGVLDALGGTLGDLAWVCDSDPGASKVLRHRLPGVPNLGDITAVDWSQVEPVDVLTGGSPCQDVSAAGKRAGMRSGTRSGLWASMCDAIDYLRPALVVWENVRGVLSAHADSALEPCPICVGDDRDAHLRALGRVVGDLSELGYDTQWTGLRAADVGASHGRFRVFVLAWPAADSGSEAVRLRPGLRPGGPGRLGWGRPDHHAAPAAADGNRPGLERGDEPGRAGQGGRSGEDGGGWLAGGCAAANAPGDGRDEGWPESAGQLGRPDAAEPGAVAPHADRNPVRQQLVGEPCGNGETVAGLPVQWGAYAPAVHRWEHVLGRVAPPPTEPGAKGQPRLSPRFVEWLMGWPAGWVTDVPGLSRNEQLKICGNGVVPQQASAAVRYMLPLLPAGRSAA